MVFEGHLVRLKILIPVLNLMYQRYNVGGASTWPSYERHRNSQAPVLSGSTDALPDGGSTACRWQRFSLPLWSPSLGPERPTAPLWGAPRWSWSSPGCENRWWVGASSRRPGCGRGRSWSRVQSSQQPGINGTRRLGKVLVSDGPRDPVLWSSKPFSSTFCGNEILAASVNRRVTRAGLPPREKSPTRNPKHTPS